MIRLRRIDHVCLRVADVDEAAGRWAVQFGLLEREREGGRALLACDDEPYSLELTAGAPGHDHTAFELARDCSLDDARAHLQALGLGWQEQEGSLFLLDCYAPCPQSPLLSQHPTLDKLLIVWHQV